MKNLTAAYHQKRTSFHHNRGISMIVVLVVLSAMSILAVGANYDTGTQFKMVRNNQFHASTYLAAYSEINAQLDDINLNEPEGVDDVILDLMELDVNEPWEIEQGDLKGPHQGQGAFDQEVEYTLTCDPRVCPSPPGYTASMITKVLRAEIRSQAEMVTAGGTFSNQAQSFWYLLPQNPLYTLD